MLLAAAFAGEPKKSRLFRLIFSAGPQPGGTAKPEAELASARRTGIRPPAVPAREGASEKGSERRNQARQQGREEALPETAGGRNCGILMGRLTGDPKVA